MGRERNYSILCISLLSLVVLSGFATPEAFAGLPDPELTLVSISSNNANTSYAQIGDVVTLIFTSNEALMFPNVTINGNPGTVTETGPLDDTQWQATRTIDGTDLEGVVTFEISADAFDENGQVLVSLTTDPTSVTVDNIGPTATVSLSGAVPLINDFDVLDFLTVTVDYDEPMDTLTSPSITFSDPSIVSGGTLSESSASWSDSDTYEVIFDIVDVGADIDSVTASAGGATDLAGNDDVDDESESFSVDMRNPEVSSIVVSDDLISDTDDDNGTTPFTITVVFDEPMKTGNGDKPTVAISDASLETAPETLTSDSGAWSDNTTFVVSYIVDDQNLDVDSVDVTVTGGGGNDGNDHIPDGIANVSTDAFEVDMLNPTGTVSFFGVIDSGTADTLINDADTVNNGTPEDPTNFVIIWIEYDEGADVLNVPTITFDPETLVSGGTLEPAGEGWLDSPPPIFVFSQGFFSSKIYYGWAYLTHDENFEGSSFDISGATDLAGNLQILSENDDAFNVDTKNPTVTTTVSDTIISDADVGTGTFSIDSAFDEPMDTGVIPTVNFDETVSGTLTINAASGWSGSTYTTVYDVADVNEEVGPVTATTTDGQDLAGNPQNADATASGNTFDIDTKNPTITSLSTNINDVTSIDGTIADVDAGGTFTVEIVYDETMDIANAPAIAFAGDIETSNTLTFTGGSWTVSDTTYTASYTIGDVGEEVADVDITVTAATDLAGNTQVETGGSNVLVDELSVDTKNPTIPASTLTISSDNTHDVTTVDDQVATAGDTITVFLDASEPLDDTLFVTNSDVLIQGVQITGTDRIFAGNTLTATLVVVDDVTTEGVALFSIQVRDVFGNEIDADASSLNVPELAENSHITDSSQVIIDHTPPHFAGPPFLITGITNPSTPETARTHDRNVTLTFDCNDSNGGIAVAGCLEADVADDGTTFRGPALITEPTNLVAELTPERGTKTVAVQYTDRAGNTDAIISGTSDTIELDAFFQNVDVNGASPEEGPWEEHSFTVNGEIVHPQVTADADLVLVDFDYMVDLEATFDMPEGFVFPGPFQVVSLTPTVDPDTFSFTASSEYPRPSQDPSDPKDGVAPEHEHTPEVTLVDYLSTSESFTPIEETLAVGDDTEVDEITANNSIVLERPTSVLLDFIANPVAGNEFPVTGLFRDDIDFTPIPGKLIEYFGDGADAGAAGVTPAADLPDSISSAGVTFADDDEVVVQYDATADAFVASFKTQSGATISFSSEPAHVNLKFVNMKDRQLLFDVTDVNGEIRHEMVSAIPTNDVWGVPITAEAGIAEIKILEIRDQTTMDLTLSPDEADIINGATLDVIQILSTSFALQGIDNITFDAAETFTEKTVNIGGIASDTKSPTTEQITVEVNAKFTQTSDPDYEPSDTTANPIPIDDDNDTLFDEGPDDEDPIDNLKVYTTRDTNTSGLGGTGTITSDSGLGIAAADCSANDIDKDAICDSWETGGIPFWANGAQAIPLPGAVVGIGDGNDRDLYVELDSMNDDVAGQSADQNGDHRLHADALAQAVAAFAEGGVVLHILEDDNIPHRDLINIWKDPVTDLDMTNDFNSIKQFHVGTKNIRSTITQTQVNTVTAVDAPNGLYELVITGWDITTPSTDLTGAGTEDIVKGIMQGNIKFRTTGDSTISVTGGNSAAHITQTAAQSFYTGEPRIVATSGSGTTHFIVFDISWATLRAQGNASPYHGGTNFPARTLEPMTIPITITDNSVAPVGCTNTDPPGTVCVGAATTTPTYPKIQSYMSNAWQQVYRYGLVAHSFGGPSGQAELRGNDFAITLGDGFSTSPNGHAGGSIPEQAGTLVHELGHILGLEHGGPERDINNIGITFADATINCKPLYPSVMSYSRQIDNFLSPWTPKFSTGEHGGNPIDSLVGGGGHTAGGITESALTDKFVLIGPAVPIIIGTPESTMGNAEVQVTSDGSDVGAGGNARIDWKDDGVDAGGNPPVNPANVNNVGISGCLDPVKQATPYYDYDDFGHMDFDFRQEPSGQFDGLSVHLSDVDSGGIWQAILGSGMFDGVEDPVEENGNSVVKVGSSVPIALEVTDADTGDLLSLKAGYAHVFVSLDPFATVNDPNPTIGWRQITDHNPDNFGEEEMLWVEEVDEITGDLTKGRLELVWKSPEKSQDMGFSGPDRFSVEQTWYGRIVLFDNKGAIDENDPGLAGSPNDATSRFLIDEVPPTLPDDVMEYATFIVQLTKESPQDMPPPPPNQGDTILDPIVTFVQFARDDGLIQKKTAKDILSSLDAAIAAFDDGNGNTNPAGCPVLDATIALVGGLDSKKIDGAIQTNLLGQLAAADIAKGCPPPP